jgi:hypothetical protein
MMLRYVGEGNFLIGVPARDLNEAEALDHGGIELLAASGLYVVDMGSPDDSIERIEDVELSRVVDLVNEGRGSASSLRKRREEWQVSEH